jgi:hypothetical protein
MYNIEIIDILLNVDKWNNENVIEFESSNKDGLEILESWKSGVTFTVIIDILAEVYNHLDNTIDFVTKMNKGNITYKDKTINKYNHIYNRFMEKK